MNIDNITVEDLIENSAKALNELQVKLSEAIACRKKQEKLDLAKHIHSLARESGFTVEELLNLNFKDKEVNKKGTKEPVKILYRNPSNHDQTWTGRGLEPKWLREATGGDKEKRKDYKI